MKKWRFLEIAHHLAWSNNDFSDTQKAVIATYCLEMQIDDISHNKNCEDSFSLAKTLAKVTKPQSQGIAFRNLCFILFAWFRHLLH